MCGRVSCTSCDQRATWRITNSAAIFSIGADSAVLHRVWLAHNTALNHSQALCRQRLGAGGLHRGAMPFDCLQARQKAALQPCAVAPAACACRTPGPGSSSTLVTLAAAPTGAQPGAKEGPRRVRGHSSPALLVMVLLCLALILLSAANQGKRPFTGGLTHAGARRARLPAVFCG